MVKSKKSLKIPKGGNQNSYIYKEQTTQWPKDRRVRRYQRGNQNKIYLKRTESGVHVTRSLAFCVFFIYRCLSFCPCSFGHCVVCFI
jgi:hypothetical protein